MQINGKDEYIKNNIELIQRKKQWTATTESQREKGKNVPFVNHTELLKYLHKKIGNISKTEFSKIYKEWVNQNFQINKIEGIAIRHSLYHSHLKPLLLAKLRKELLKLYTTEKIELLSDKIINDLNKQIPEKYGFKSIKSDMKKNLPDSIYNALRGGFSNNIKNVKFGEDVTFSGQASQFLFIGRALRAGYVASNVDLPSSKYDAILDTGKNKIVTIQIKGFEGGRIDFFSRTRGGQGVDQSHIRNQAQRITSTQCDFYVAVDKRNGMCYIIPLIDIDQYNDEQVQSLKLADLHKYKEAWHLFD